MVGWEFAADDPDRVQEGGPVRVLTPLQGGFVHEGANREVGQEQSVELLADQIRGLAAQDDAGAS